MNVQSPFISNSQAPEATQPSQRALHYPSVLAEPLVAFHPTSSYARDDAPLSECSSASFKVVPFVRMQLTQTLSAPSAKLFRLLGRSDSIYNIGKGIAVVQVGSCADESKRYSLPVNHQMPLGASFTLICGMRASSFAPLLAGTLAESTAAHDQSIAPSSPSLSSRAWCRACQTPSCCQSRNLRQHVIPRPQHISFGSSSQGVPLRSYEKDASEYSFIRNAGTSSFGLRHILR